MGTHKANYIEAAHASQNRHKWHLENFFPVMTIFYHYHFRNKKSVEVSMDWLKAPYPTRACHSKRLHHAAKEMFDSRKPFCKYPHDLASVLSCTMSDQNVSAQNAGVR